MARKSRRRKSEDIRLDMTPMIDCVFQLLIFFLVSMKFEDIVAHLDVFRPAPDPNAKPEQNVVDMVTVGVFRDGITLNDRRVSSETLANMLVKIASYGKNQTILIKCAPDSQHDRLVQVLDLCSRAELSKLSVVSL